MRGDVPGVTDSVVDKIKFSPRARGCSDLCEMVAFAARVFPACAGMFRGAIGPDIYPQSFPRVRGDVPPLRRGTALGAVFSPRARGCSADRRHDSCCAPVFPACAGMFRTRRCARWHSDRFPRVRGDVPSIYLNLLGVVKFSPRARGCSG